MSVHAPGRVVLGGLGRARTGFARAIARVRPSAPHGGGRRKLMGGLSMTSMIDVLVVMTVFLLLTFNADQKCGRDLSHLPPAANVEDVLDAPMVFVTASGVEVDGTLAASRGDLASTNGRVARIDVLFNVLKQKHELSKQLTPGREPPTHVLLAIDGDVPAHVVKSVVMTAARSGYPQIDFLVHAGGKGG